jgi:hypothetical protein
MSFPKKVVAKAPKGSLSLRGAPGRTKRLTAWYFWEVPWLLFLLLAATKKA